MARDKDVVVLSLNQVKSKITNKIIMLILTKKIMIKTNYKMSFMIMNNRKL